MSKQFEELSKNLATGMSRRKAFGRFAAGIGAALGALALPKLAGATQPAYVRSTEEFCTLYCGGTLRLRGKELEYCVYECGALLHVNI